MNREPVTVDSYFDHDPTRDEIQTAVAEASDMGYVERWLVKRTGHGGWYYVRVHYQKETR